MGAGLGGGINVQVLDGVALAVEHALELGGTGLADGSPGFVVQVDVVTQQDGLALEGLAFLIDLSGKVKPCRRRW